MTEDVVIRAEGLGKKYLIGHEAKREPYVALRDVIARAAHTAWRKTVDMARGRAIVAGDTTEEFWALKDLDFEITRGEVVGIIGHNGAGKSTLLKILSRITEPTEGQVTVLGRVASLLEIGTGFHPELTGRENIYLNGAILGMSRGEIRRKFDEIVSFAEVERFLDTPVKRYSSGMYVRLAFAVAAHLEPEILIVDEVLAVGDIEFQRKCLGKMSEVASGGRTILFVSHNMAAIQALCPQTLYLRSGALVGAGKTSQILPMYLGDHRTRVRLNGGNSIKVQDGLVLKQFTCTPEVISSGSPIDIAVVFSAERPALIREFAVLVYSMRGVRIGILDLRDSGKLPFRQSTGEICIKFRIQDLHLVEGDYTLGLFLATDHFVGDLFELAGFSIASEQSHEYAPYSPENRGIIAIPATSMISSSHQAQVNHAGSQYDPLPT